MPTVEEIDLIFRAWRSSELCKKVWQLSEFGIIAPIFLRTRYGPKNDKMMEEGISAFEEVRTMDRVRLMPTVTQNFTLLIRLRSTIIANSYLVSRRGRSTLSALLTPNARRIFHP
ncbi:hypothetical protein POX_d05727 [Penicillium oxalicum]|uniref:hypothetical protein n=1 Tax=Penicillium oxalicum TaxID=69781 RepID=UPI0020B88263|nr:hypothetical protein POX_d05727 [Penicillium oxalicum]KAI2790221.1 hypothetical protein POX_d05727 [Penicillium oxalicum]